MVTIDECEINLSLMIVQARQLNANIQDIHINAIPDRALKTIEQETNHIRNTGLASSNYYFSKLYRRYDRILRQLAFSESSRTNGLREEISRR